MLTISSALSAAQVKTYHEKEYTNAQNYWQKESINPGVWVGSLAKDMGLSGPVDFEVFAKIAEGRNPVTDKQIIRHINRAGYTDAAGKKIKPVQHRAAWDATFSASKSVSLTALEDNRVIDAHNKAVTIALERIEKYVQARTGNKSSETTGKMVAARFEHYTARPVNGYSAPQLHSHVVIFNMTQRRDKSFNALQTQALFDCKQYGTAIYQAELMYQLRQLGYQIESGKSGAPEIAGYSQEYMAASSPRRKQIEDQLEKAQVSGPRAAQIAAHRTRDKKAQASPEEILAAHKEMAEKYGNQPEKVVRDARLRVENGQIESVDEKSLARSGVAYAKEHNHEREAAVDDRDLVRDALRRHMGSIRLSDVEPVFKSEKDQGKLVEVTHAAPVQARAGGNRFTTPEIIAAEKYVIKQMQNGHDAVSPLMEVDDVKTLTANREWLNDAQKNAVKEIVTSRERVHGLQGLAGTGKTKGVLELVKDGAERNGYVVQGFAPTAKAAVEMRDANISADTVQGFITKGGQDQTSDIKHFYIIDEASLSSTLQMKEFISRLGAEDRLLIVGDTRQHEAVEAGKPFQQLQEAGMVTSVLDSIIRQKNADLREAVEHLSRNEVKAGIEKLHDMGCIHTVQGAKERVSAIAERYMQSPSESLVVSPDNASRKMINEEVRGRLIAAKMVASEGREYSILVNRNDLTGADRKWAARYNVGEFVQYHKGSTIYNLKRDEIAKVTSVDAKTKTITVERSDGRSLTYDPQRLSGVSVYREEVRTFAVGDKIQFTAVDRNLGVNNRDIATVQDIAEDGKITATITRGKKENRIKFDPTNMRMLDYGYAMTSHSSQGVTVRNVIVNMDLNTHKDLINTRLAYVAVSRAAEEAHIYTGGSIMKDAKTESERIHILVDRLGRNVSKESAIEASLMKEAERNSKKNDLDVKTEAPVVNDLLISDAQVDSLAIQNQVQARTERTKSTEVSMEID